VLTRSPWCDYHCVIDMKRNVSIGLYVCKNDNLSFEEGRSIKSETLFVNTGHRSGCSN